MNSFTFKAVLFLLISGLCVVGDCGPIRNFLSNRRSARQERRASGNGVFGRGIVFGRGGCASCASSEASSVPGQQIVNQDGWRGNGAAGEQVVMAKVCYCDDINTCGCQEKGCICIDKNGRTKMIN